VPAVVTRIAYDQAAKKLLGGALDAGGRVTAQQEVASEARWIDVWFEPDPRGPVPPGLLGRMVRVARGAPSAFEVFHNGPRLMQAFACLGKLLSMVQRSQRRTRPRRKRSSSSERRRNKDPMPCLWLVSAGRPTAVLRGLEMVPLRDWPAGFYRTTLRELPVFSVVVAELPRENDTLLLRLMGARKVLRRALEDLRVLPTGSWELAAASEAVSVLHSYAVEAANTDPEDKAIIMTATQIYEKIKDEGRKEGRKEGREEGRKEGREEGRKEGREELLLRLLAQRFGKLPAKVVARIHAADSAQLDRWGERVISAATLEEIFAKRG
jgi:hypothetical protein